MERETNNAGLNFTRRGAGDVALVFLHYFGGSSRAWSPGSAKVSPWPERGRESPPGARMMQPNE